MSAHRNFGMNYATVGTILGKTERKTLEVTADANMEGSEQCDCRVTKLLGLLGVI